MILFRLHLMFHILTRMNEGMNFKSIQKTLHKINIKCAILVVENESKGEVCIFLYIMKLFLHWLNFFEAMFSVVSQKINAMKWSIIPCLEELLHAKEIFAQKFSQSITYYKRKRFHAPKDLKWSCSLYYYSFIPLRCWSARLSLFHSTYFNICFTDHSSHVLITMKVFISIYCIQRFCHSFRSTSYSIIWNVF